MNLALSGVVAEVESPAIVPDIRPGNRRMVAKV